MVKARGPKLVWVGIGLLFLAAGWGLRVWQGPGDRFRPDLSTYQVRTLHEGDHTIAPGQCIRIPFDWSHPVLRMPSVPPDPQPYEEPEDRLEMSVSVSEGAVADVWLVSEPTAAFLEGKRPASQPREAIDPFSRSGSEGSFDVTYHHNMAYCSFLLANPSDSRPVTLHFRLRRGYWRIEPQT